VDSIDCAKQKIRKMIAHSEVPEDLRHAKNTLKWVLKLDQEADQAMRIAALAHDIDRAVEARKVRREDFNDYNVFKAAHARNGAAILRTILKRCDVAKSVVQEACRLVTLHEIGGDPRSDLLKDADSISFFDVNMPLYYGREGREETIRRCIWGYRRISERMKKVVKTITYADDALTGLLEEAIRQACLKDESGGL